MIGRRVVRSPLFFSHAVYEGQPHNLRHDDEFKDLMEEKKGVKKQPKEKSIQMINISGPPESLCATLQRPLLIFVFLSHCGIYGSIG